MAFEPVNATQIEFQWKQFVASQALSYPELVNARVNVHEPANMLGLVVQLHTYIASRDRKSETIRYPRDWWEALKQRWFPAWALRRWPAIIVEHTFTAYDVYPEANIPMRMGSPVLKIAHYQNTIGLRDEK